MKKIINGILIVILILMVLCACSQKNVDENYDELKNETTIITNDETHIEETTIEQPIPLEQKSTEEVIHDIILDYNKKLYSGGDVQACGFWILDEEDIDPVTRRVTGFVSYGEYINENNMAVKLSGSGEIPTAITYSISDPTNYSYQEILTEDKLEKEAREMFKEKDLPHVLKRDQNKMEKIKEMELKEAEKKLDIKR